ncbi:hypothetical protein [Serratia sp. 22264]|uniref:hypothetical protein n=1 Tax=Serratia sp. 22264 TaxID=3453897 RepID=UPI003F873E07
MGHIPVSHPSGDMKSFQFAPGKLVDGQGRYDPFGTLSLITGFVSSLVYVVYRPGRLLPEPMAEL